jgi:sugar/nucleoside kinase (ribokinase family)
MARILSVGSVSVDLVYVHPALEALGDFKAQAEHAYMQAGGGGANMAIAMRALNTILGLGNEITLCTKIGDPPVGDKLSKLAKEIAIDELRGLHFIDAVPETPHIIPSNSPVSYPGGRFISTRFTEATMEFQPRVENRIKMEAANSDMVFIHSRYPRLSRIAAVEAQKKGTPVFYDYSVEDPGNNALHGDLLGLSTYVVAPGEARAGSMKQADPQELRRILTENYGIAHVAVSNGTDPVLVSIDGQYQSIEVPRADRVIDALGVGDLRNAMTITAMLRGDDFLTALRKGTAMATFSVGYPGRDWIKDAPAFLRAHPLFANDFPQAASTAVPGNDGLRIG